MKYVYDGSFPGFLSVVYCAYHDGTSRVESISPYDGNRDLFGMEAQVATDFGHAERVADAFCRKCGKDAFRWMYHAFLCDDGSEDFLFDYIVRGFRLGKRIYAYSGDPWMWNVLSRSQKTGNEAEKFRGILRFSELAEGMLYAEIRPTHHVLPLIAGHFRRRMAGEEWAIHDMGRRLAVYYDRKELILVHVENPSGRLLFSGEEKNFRKLWRDYWSHMAIEERKNPVLQRSFLPKKYWGFLTEMGRT